MGSSVKGFLTVLGAVALLGTLILVAVGSDRRKTLCASAGLCDDPDFVAAMVESVRREQKFVIFSARLVVPVTSERATTLALVTVATTRQTAILPGSVNYSLDLSGLSANDLKWEPDARTLTIFRPPVLIEEPTIQWDKAQKYAETGWQTVLTSVSENLQRDNEKQAPKLFRKQAEDPELKRMADAAADHALTAVFSMPLHAAGFPDAKVVVKRKDG